MRKVPKLKAAMALIQNVRKLSRKDLYIGPLIPSLIVFGALMVIIVLSWRTAKYDVVNQYNEAVNQNISYVEETLTQRLAIYEDTLRSGAGLFNGSDSVTRGEWHTFISSLKLPSRYPGIRSIGFVSIVGAAGKDAFIEAARQDGVADYEITPAASRDRYAPITYIVPTTEDIAPAEALSSVYGYDMYSDPIRMQAMDDAVATGEPTLSAKVNLVQTGGGDRPGFLLFMPIYKKGMPLGSPDERRAAADGFTYAPFAADNFFPSLYTIQNPNFSFAIYDKTGTEDNKLYQSDKDFNSPKFTEARKNSISIYGQNWPIIYRTKKEIVSSSLRQRPFSVVYGGTLFAFVTAMMVYLLIQRRTSSLAYAEQRRLEEAKDELLSLASHQLRTPATAVKQYISMVRDGYAGKLSKEQAKLLDMAYESNERQLTIVDDLLYVARLDAGQATLTYERFDLQEILRSVIDDHRILINSRRQKVKLHGPKRKVFLEGDPKYVRMIFENLLSNASKYSRVGKKIDIMLRTIKDKAIISFTDQGVGIHSDDFENVFKKFSRITNELTRQTAGSGIGLYLARQLTRLHGGDIILSSTMNAGSTFTVELPFKQPV